MKPSAHETFLDLQGAELAEFARRAGSEMGLPPGYLANVIENLSLLQGHARLMAAALQARGLGAADAGAGTFEP